MEQTSQSASTVTIVAPIYNGGPHYPTCFASLCALSYPSGQLEVIVIDDCSTDGTRQFLQDAQAPEFVTKIFPDSNLGRSAARNLGTRSATGEIIIYLDGDMEVQPDYVGQLVAELGKPGREAVLGKVEPAPWLRRSRLLHYLYRFPNRGAKRYPPDSPIGFQYLLTHNLALSRAAVDAGGPFDEAFIHHGGEDTLFAYHVAKAFPNGLFYADQPVALHHHERSLGQYLKALYDYGYHNLPRIIERYPELATPLAADYAWPFPGPLFRRKRLAAWMMFNSVSYGLMRLLTIAIPSPISDYAIRYLTVGAVVRGLSKYVKKVRPEPFPRSPKQDPHHG